VREYGKVAPQFWTGTTGRQIRELGPDAQRVALYLLTGPSAHETGLYPLALPLVAHHLGTPLKGATRALRSLEGVGFAHYDDEAEHVWVPEMARFQIGESLKDGDRRVWGVAASILAMRSSRFFGAFVEKYREPYRLETAPRWPEITRALQAPSDPLRSKENEKEKEQEKDSVTVGAPAPTPASKVVRARIASMLPEDFTLTDARRQFALDGGITDAGLEFGHFKDHHRAKGSRFIDWDAAWRTWCRNAVKFAARRA
jgi:hypothetical protein